MLISALINTKLDMPKIELYNCSCKMGGFRVCPLTYDREVTWPTSLQATEFFIWGGRRKEK